MCALSRQHGPREGEIRKKALLMKWHGGLGVVGARWLLCHRSLTQLARMHVCILVAIQSRQHHQLPLSPPLKHLNLTASLSKAQKEKLHRRAHHSSQSPCIIRPYGHKNRAPNYLHKSNKEQSMPFPSHSSPSHALYARHLHSTPSPKPQRKEKFPAYSRIQRIFPLLAPCVYSP